MRHKGYTSDPLLPKVRAANREFEERRKERKDAEKRRRERKRKDRDERDKAKREREKEGKSTPEPGSSPSTPGDVDYSMMPDLDMEAAGGQSPVQRGAGTEPPSSVGGGTHALMTGEGSPAQADAETLGQVSPPRPQSAPSAPPVGHSAGVGGWSRTTKSVSRKRKLDAALG